jgi:hypothetical protein
VINTMNHDTECRFSAPEVLPPLVGSQRVALHSIFRIICEANQLAVQDVLNAFSVPILGVPKEQGRRLFHYLQTVDAGSPQSTRLIEFLEKTTGLDDLLSLTLRCGELWQYAGPPVMRTTQTRKWCPHCYFQDISSGLPPYDRLLWSIDLVRYCPVHNVRLASVCPGCHRTSANHPFKSDASGFCPRCMTWLGNRTLPSPATDDDQTRHGKWSAQAFTDILEVAPVARNEVLPRILCSLRKLTATYHAGKSAHLARQIGRNKSVVATWLAGGACPRWHALADIGYVYQQPLTLLLQGKVNITATQPLTLPNSVRHRQGNPRGSPVSREPAVVAAFLNEVSAGLHPSISSVSAAAQRLTMDLREVYRLAPDAAKNASAALEARSVLHRAAQAARRSQARDSAIGRVATVLASRDCKVTRRVVFDEMARQGYEVRWSESKEVVDLVRQQTKLAEAGPRT